MSIFQMDPKDIAVDFVVKYTDDSIDRIKNIDMKSYEEKDGLITFCVPIHDENKLVVHHFNLKNIKEYSLEYGERKDEMNN